MQSEDMICIASSFTAFMMVWQIVARMPLPFKPEHVKISKEDELDLRLRIVSFIHGILCVIFAGYHFYMLHG